MPATKPVMPVEVGTRGIVGSSVYDLLTKLSICGNKRTKALKFLAKTIPGGSGRREIRIKNALTIAGTVGNWISNPSRDGFESWRCEKRDNRETPGCGPAPLECQRFRAETLASRGIFSLKTPCYLAPQ